MDVDVNDLVASLGTDAMAIFLCTYKIPLACNYLFFDRNQSSRFVSFEVVNLWSDICNLHFMAVVAWIGFTANKKTIRKRYCFHKHTGATCDGGVSFYYSLEFSSIFDKAMG